MSSNKYWDAEDILMSNEMISCTAEIDLYGIENLEKNYSINQEKSKEMYLSNEMNEYILFEGEQKSLPIWAALLLIKYSFISITPPKFLTEKFFNALLADPTILNLKEKNNYFYDTCIALIPFLENEQNWKTCLTLALYKRFLFFQQNSTNVEYENHSINRIASRREIDFYEKIVKINKNIRFYLENYSKNNKNLDELIQNKKVSYKKKKVNNEI